MHGQIRSKEKRIQFSILAQLVVLLFFSLQIVKGLNKDLFILNDFLALDAFVHEKTFLIFCFFKVRLKTKKNSTIFNSANTL